MLEVSEKEETKGISKQSLTDSSSRGLTLKSGDWDKSGKIR